MRHGKELLQLPLHVSMQLNRRQRSAVVRPSWAGKGPQSKLQQNYCGPKPWDLQWATPVQRRGQTLGKTSLNPNLGICGGLPLWQSQFEPKPWALRWATPVTGRKELQTLGFAVGYPCDGVQGAWHGNMIKFASGNLGRKPFRAKP